MLKNLMQKFKENKRVRTISMIEETQVMESILLLKEKNILGYDNCICCKKEINNEDDFHSFHPIENKTYIICSMKCMLNWFHKIMTWNNCGITNITEKSLPKFNKYLQNLKDLQKLGIW